MAAQPLVGSPVEGEDWGQIAGPFPKTVSPYRVAGVRAELYHWGPTNSLPKGGPGRAIARVPV